VELTAFFFVMIASGSAFLGPKEGLSSSLILFLSYEWNRSLGQKDGVSYPVCESVPPGKSARLSGLSGSVCKDELFPLRTKGLPFFEEVIG